MGRSTCVTRVAVALLVALLVGACEEPLSGPQGPLFGASPARPLDLRAALSSEEAALLDEVELIVDAFVGDDLDEEQAKRAHAFEPLIPEGFAYDLRAGPARPWQDGTWRQFVVRLRPTELGDLTIPPFELRAGDDGPVATSRELTLHVTSLLADADEDVEAPAPPFPAPLDLTPWLVATGGLVLLGGMIWYWRRLRRLRGLAQPAQTAPPAHVVALRALGRLRNAPRSSAEQVEEFYVEVSRILRVYLEQRFALRAPERTTEEFLVEMRRSDALGARDRSQLAEFLAQCDLVKFARLLPGSDVHERTFAIAEQFVEATRADRAPERQGGSPAEGAA